jgi:G3E family GTPase
VGIDDALVLQSQEEIFEMNNGCICCTGMYVIMSSCYLDAMAFVHHVYARILLTELSAAAAQGDWSEHRLN